MSLLHVTMHLGSDAETLKLSCRTLISACYYSTNIESHKQCMLVTALMAAYEKGDIFQMGLKGIIWWPMGISRPCRS